VVGDAGVAGPPQYGLDPRRSERWLARAQELDRLARTRPRQYRLRVALVGAGGYAFIVGLAVLQLVAAVVVAVLVVRGTLHGLGALTWPFVLVAYGCYALSSLWMSRGLPDGSPITTATAPMLVDTVNELRIRLDAPPVDILVLDSSANAGVLQQSRFGPFGPYRNVLVIGLPLLQALPLDELRAVIAHELAHLARRHGHLGAWVYRLRKAYPELLERLENKGWTAAVVRVFFERYVPYFDLCTLAMARAHEFEADRLAAEICRPAVVAAALRRSVLLDRFLAERKQLPAPAEAIDGDADDRWADLLDSHPSVARRLQALDAASEPLPPLTASAATALLPGELALGLRQTDLLDSPALQRFAAFSETSTRAASGEGVRR
jgi:Zn-dependent protease with chaperone function